MSAAQCNSKVAAHVETAVDAARTRDFLAWLIERSKQASKPALRLIEKENTDRAA